jgi:hypothetical protein
MNTTMETVPARRRLAGLALALLAAGCGGRGDVTGTVKYKGEVLSYARITFYGQTGKKEVRSAEVRDGKYALEGFPAGPVKVTVETFRPASQVPKTQPPAPGGKAAVGGKAAEDMMGGHVKGLPSDDKDKPSEPPKDVRSVPIPTRYASLESTDLSYTVNTGSNTIDIELQP